MVAGEAKAGLEGTDRIGIPSPANRAVPVKDEVADVEGVKVDND